MIEADAAGGLPVLAAQALSTSGKAWRVGRLDRRTIDQDNIVARVEGSAGRRASRAAADRQKPWQS